MGGEISSVLRVHATTSSSSSLPGEDCLVSLRGQYLSHLPFSAGKTGKQLDHFNVATNAPLLSSRSVAFPQADHSNVCPRPPDLRSSTNKLTLLNPCTIYDLGIVSLYPEMANKLACRFKLSMPGDTPPKPMPS